MALCVLIVCSLAAVIASRALGEGLAWTSFLFLLILLGSVSGFLFPTQYFLDDEGITVKHLFSTRRRSWKEVHRIELSADTALIANMRVRSRLDRFRGIVVPFDEAPQGTREALIARAHALS